MRAVICLVASAVVAGGCGAPPIDLSSRATPIAPSPPVVSSPTAAPTYSVALIVYTLGTPCSGCRMEITTGPSAGLSTTTTNGHGTLYVQDAPSVTLRVSKDRYRAATTSLTLDGRNSAGTVVLQSEGPAIDLAGARFLDLQAADSCDRLPVALRARTYPVSLARSGQGLFRAEPVGQQFKTFVVEVGASVDEAIFEVLDRRKGTSGIIEELPDGGTLQIDLWMWAVVPVENPNAISTSIEGSMMYCDASSRCTAVCESRDHQLTLTRR